MLGIKCKWLCLDCETKTETLQGWDEQGLKVKLTQPECCQKCMNHNFRLYDMQTCELRVIEPEKKE